MNLYLVQHSEAKSKEEDPQRPLSEKGLDNITKISNFISKHIKIDVKAIMHSGKLRAQQTAEILSKHLNPSDGIKIVDGLEPLTTPSIWVERLASSKDDILLVGHLPHLSKLASSLICQNENKTIINFKNAGIVCLNRDESGNWSLFWALIPDILNQ